MQQVTETISQHVTTSSKLLKRFLFSQYFSDGVRITLGILLPSVIAYNLGHISEGIAISLGALCVSIPDNPGPFEHRRNAMLITMALIFSMAILTALLAKYTFILAVFIGISCFVMGMLHVFGARAAAVGVSVLVVLILGIDQQVTALQALIYAGLVTAGGAWYFVLSISNQKLLPYRAAQQLLGECTLAIADFIRLKGGFYNTTTPVQEQYQKIIKQQALVNELLEHVREILFKTRKIMVDTSPAGRELLISFLDLVDLYEQSMATHYDYEQIRNTYKNSTILPYFEQLILQVGDELEQLGNAIHNNQKSNPIHHFIPKLNVLKNKVDELEANGQNTLVLKRILVNLRNIALRLERIYTYKISTENISKQRSDELYKFVQPQHIDWAMFKAHITPKSNHFRHAMRMAIICVLAFVFARTVYQAQYSYWILLTILVILKPGFSLTKKRNYERVIGTIAGGIIGLMILKYFPGVNARMIFLTTLMLLAFSFMRVNYVVSVLFMTPYVLIVFSFTGNDNGLSVAWERIVDTLIGATLAFGASYFIFPSWESYQLKSITTDVIQANIDYLKSIFERTNDPLSQSRYKLARKEVYIKSSNLTTAFQRMLSEPKSKQQHTDWLYELTIINNQLISYFATLSYQHKNDDELNDEQKRWIRSVYQLLFDALQKLNETKEKTEIQFTKGTQTSNIGTDFLVIIHQTATDFLKNIPNASTFATHEH